VQQVLSISDKLVSAFALLRLRKNVESIENARRRFFILIKWGCDKFENFGFKYSGQARSCQLTGMCF
jgi:hypothetical protein